MDLSLLHFFSIWRFNLIKQERKRNEQIIDDIQDLPLTAYWSWNQIIKIAAHIPTACNKLLKRSQHLFKTLIIQTVWDDSKMWLNDCIKYAVNAVYEPAKPTVLQNGMQGFTVSVVK